MAKMIKWVDRVGEEKLIETKEGQVYIATINQVVKVLKEYLILIQQH